jgi:hypothetical protein
MKRLLLIVTLMLFACSALAADVTFAWDYTDGASAATGFELRISASSMGVPIVTQDCPGAATRECKVLSVAKGKYYATAYAYAVDDVGKQYSGPSNEVVFQITGNPNSPINLRIKK